MKILKQLSKKTKDKIYSKFVVVLPEKLVKESRLVQEIESVKSVPRALR